MKIQLVHKFEDIISLENLLEAWKEVAKGKRNKKDVQEFSIFLMDNVFSLHFNLTHCTYRHGDYQSFKINDPKPRDIHKATVRDRLLHHAIYRILYPFFDRVFITDSYSCRNNKGTHKAIDKFRGYFYKVSKNNTKTCWVLKCDIKKFFASIDHEIVIGILDLYIPDKDILWLLDEVVRSFETNPGKGLPLGNLTSQLFANIYLNKLDQFIKHWLKARYYIRYADDFVIFSDDKKWLENQIEKISEFLAEELELQLHPNKIFIKTLASGVDFLGMINFFDHRVLRAKTKKRMMSRVKIGPTPETINSYLGLLKHGNGGKLQKEIFANFW